MTFFQEPRRARQPFLLAPWPVLLLIGILAAAYAAFAFAPPALQGRALANFAFYPARYSAAFIAAHSYNPGTLFERALPFVSYIFMHGSLGHLTINCVWLLPFGSVVARRFGATAFYVFFLLCGAAGAAGHLAFNWGSTLPVVGASGAISGLMGASFRMIGNSGQYGGHGGVAPLFSRRIVTWTAVWVGVNVLAGVTGLGAGTEVRLVAWQAHLGGYFAGLLLVGPFLTLVDTRLEPPDIRHR